MQACVATFLASDLKISGFHLKQKMRLRTFYGGGVITERRNAADIKEHKSLALAKNNIIIPKEND